MSWTRLGRRLVDFEVKLREVLFVNPAANALRGGHRPHSTTTPLRQGQSLPERREMTGSKCESQRCRQKDTKSHEGNCDWIVRWNSKHRGHFWPRHRNMR